MKPKVKEFEEMLIAKDKEDNPITYEEVIERLRNVPLEQYTSKDVFDRYIAYGTEEELNSPPIQHLLISKGYISQLTDMAEVITDKQIIIEILKSDLFTNPDIILKQGRIANLKFEEYKNIPQCIVSKFDFIDKDGQEIQLNGHIMFNPSNIEEYKQKLKPYMDNVAVILQNMNNNKVYFRCFLKVYEDIDYNVQ